MLLYFEQGWCFYRCSSELDSFDIQARQNEMFRIIVTNFPLFLSVSLQNDEVARKQSELRQQKAIAAEEERRRMNLLNALSRNYTTSDDSESFCT